MQYTDLPSTWSSTLEKLALHTGHAQPPTGAHTPWYTTLMRFGKRGFFLAFLTSREDERVALRLEMSHPTEDKAQAFARELGARLQTLGMKDVTIQHDPGAPAFIDMSSGERLDSRAESIEALLLLLMKTGDYIIALDQDPNATSPLQDTSQPIKAPLTTETPAGFEVIGARDATPQPPASSAFETIGGSKPMPPSSADTGASDEVQIARHDIRMRQDHVLLELELTPAQAHPSLVTGLEQMLGTRFDALVAVIEAPSAGSGTLRMRLQPGLTTATQREVDALGEDITRYIKKLKDFCAMGVSLKEILGVTARTSRASSRASSPRDRPERTTRRDIPSRRDTSSSPHHSEEPAAESTGFVLGLGSPQSSSSASSEARRAEDPEHTLTPGDFTDTRLRREDADGPLVDLVLRHPGYSDRNMSKVLTLLLSIEYSKAMGLIEKAPCVLSWGIGRERAQTMKSVIEGAGGKVVMVEPDTFAAS